MPLLSVEPQRLYRQIAEQVRLLIGSGEFAAHERLPAERDLARQLGVSRPTVREALIALEVEGWVEVRCGSGVYAMARPVPVCAPLAAQTAAEWGPLELIRARRVVEEKPPRSPLPWPSGAISPRFGRPLSPWSRTPKTRCLPWRVTGLSMAPSFRPVATAF